MKHAINIGAKTIHDFFRVDSDRHNDIVRALEKGVLEIRRKKKNEFSPRDILVMAMTTIAEDYSEMALLAYIIGSTAEESAMRKGLSKAEKKALAAMKKRRGKSKDPMKMLETLMKKVDKLTKKL